MTDPPFHKGDFVRLYAPNSYQHCFVAVHEPQFYEGCWRYGYTPITGAMRPATREDFWGWLDCLRRDAERATRRYQDAAALAELFVAREGILT